MVPGRALTTSHCEGRVPGKKGEILLGPEIGSGGIPNEKEIDANCLLVRLKVIRILKLLMASNFTDRIIKGSLNIISYRPHFI